MATRPSWSGHLRISLVTFPVEIYPASLPARNIPLHQIHKPSGDRVRNQPVVEGAGPIEKDDIVKGFEYRKGEHIELTADEMANVRLATTKQIDIVEFTDQDSIDPIYWDRPYFVVPKTEVGEQAYLVFREALKQTKKVAIGEVVFSAKEHLIAIRPCGRGMMLETLRYADEVRDAKKYFEDLPKTAPSADQLALAKELIKKKSSEFNPKDFEDSYEEALRDLIDRKLKKLPIRKIKDEETPSNVINLMDALKKSVNKKNNASRTSKPARRKVAAKRKRA